MKIRFEICIACLCGLNVMAQELRDIKEKYAFPTKPGTQAWADLRDSTEKVAACEIPVGLAKRMTTEALIQTCLHYPLKGYITADSGGSPDFLDNLFNNFYGFKELASRSDAGKCLTDYYDDYAAKVLAGKKIDAMDQMFLYWLCSRPEISVAFTAEQKEKMALLTMQIAARFNALKEEKHMRMAPVKYALELIVRHDVVIRNNGVKFDKSMLPAAAIKYIKGGERISVEEGDWVSVVLDAGKNIVK